ncbi:Uma2 family endonuclease [Saccharomonospora halophila]|uniref:Uma2 family endonuclease n=1 Tax=Saccharomonospora halophila TaxID=129922 RepID=UPI00048E646F|nr:Uma2 family endonuclease [Saccharomonospora halophila]
MTGAHRPRPLSLTDWDALPEDESAHVELREGRLIESPRPDRRHSRAVSRLVRVLDDQLPAGVEGLREFEVLIRDRPLPTVRVPDVVVTRADGPTRRLRAADVLVAIEVVSPGSKRTDTVTETSEYAESGIPHYWVVDLDDPVSLVAHHFAGEFGYLAAPAVTRVFSTTDPVPLHVDPDALPRAR